MKLTSHLILRTSIAFAFAYAGISSLMTPDNWVGYIPAWVNSIMPVKSYLFFYSFFEIGLALWLISGVKTVFAALIAATAVFAIIFFNFTDLMIVFRDISILGASLALAKLSTEKNR